MTSSMDGAPSKDDIQSLLNYLDILYPNGESIDPVQERDRDNIPTYKTEANLFFQLVGLCAQTRKYDAVTAYLMSQDPEKVATANWKEIRQMLTCMVRSDRVSFYAQADAIQSGRIRQILLRIKKLAEQWILKITIYCLN